MLNPILSFSATRRMRSFKTLLIAAAYVVVMLAVTLLIMGRIFGNEATFYSIRNSVTCYQAQMVTQFILILLIAPAMTSGAIAGERERQTLELLLVTNTRSFRIVIGKAMESFAMLALLIVCGFPVMCLTMVAGAVTLPQILIGELFLLLIAFASVSVGVFSSTLARSTVASGVISYLILLAIGGLTLIPLIMDFPVEVTSVVYDTSSLAALAPGDALKMISPVLLCNPGYALIALLHGQTGMLTSTMEYREIGRLLCEFRLMDKAGGETLALISCGIILVLAVLLLLAAGFLLRKNSLKPAKRTK
ncbi:MAG: ABC transporter permease [Clostridia bacterium]|nr:ABC transporter permease [Clostridia bacterium]